MIENNIWKSLKCPLCDGIFSSEQLYQHNNINNDDFKSVIENIINERVSLERKKMEGEIQLRIENYEKELQLKSQKEEKDFLIKWSEKEANYLKEIEELKITNSQNRVLNNKVKGENWEIEVENELRKAFGYFDSIEKITAGSEIDNKKADYLQLIKNGENIIGKIVYEVKNAKWSETWVPKLANDTANNKTKYGILVASSFNDKYRGDIPFIQSDQYPNIWIANPWSFIFLAQVLRRIIEIEYNFETKEKTLMASINKDDEKAILAEYKKEILALQNYLDYEMPEFMLIFNKQLEEIRSIKDSISKTSDKHVKKLEKVYNTLQTKFISKVKQQLESIRKHGVRDIKK